MNKSRAEAFSDSVFAFAITLLVLGVQVPQLRTGSNQELRDSLVRSIPQLLPYITSFATIGVIWLNHHSMFHQINRVDHTTLTLNLLMLMVVAFIPYPTAILSRYGALPASVFFYGIVMTVLGCTFSLLWFHILRKGLHSGIKTQAERRDHMKRNLAGSIVYPIAAIIGLHNPKVSVVIYVLVPAYYFIPNRQRTHGQH
jgi:uncharacterized membrane protein